MEWSEKLSATLLSKQGAIIDYDNDDDDNNSSSKDGKSGQR
jgi:hypothetical protein